LGRQTTPARPYRVGFALPGASTPEVVFHLLNPWMMQARRLPLTLLFFLCTLPLLAQNPLVGTWERVTDSIRSVKIITPTHWIVFIEGLQGEGSKFQMAHGGTYTLTGNKYIEHIHVASWPEPEKARTEFIFYEVGDYTFLQKGTVTLGNGRVIPIDEVWQRVTDAKVNPDFPAIGTWNRQSYSVLRPGAKKETYVGSDATCFEIITPSHWMRINHRNKKFERASGGSYTAEGNKAYPRIDYASYPINQKERLESTQKVAGDKRHSTLVFYGPDGKKLSTLEEVLEKVNAKPQEAKTVVKK
jgi:hypothetical protein